MYSGYVMYYKLSLKHYYYFHVCYNKYYYLQKEKNYPLNSYEVIAQFILKVLYVRFCYGKLPLVEYFKDQTI